MDFKFYAGIWPFSQITSLKWFKKTSYFFHENSENASSRKLKKILGCIEQKRRHLNILTKTLPSENRNIICGFGRIRTLDPSCQSPLTYPFGHGGRGLAPKKNLSND